LTGDRAAGEAPWRLGGLLRQGEAGAVLSAGAAYFFLLCGYYMLRSLREAFALEVGRESIATLFYVASAVMAFVLPIYWFVVARFPRRLMFPVILTPVSCRRSTGSRSPR